MGRLAVKVFAIQAAFCEAHLLGPATVTIRFLHPRVPLPQDFPASDEWWLSQVASYEEVSHSCSVARSWCDRPSSAYLLSVEFQEAICHKELHLIGELKAVVACGVLSIKESHDSCKKPASKANVN